MKARKISLRGLLLALVLALGLSATSQTARADPGIDVGLDMDPTGNFCSGSGSDCTLGTIDQCIAVPNTAGYDFQVDLWVSGLGNGFEAWSDNLAFPNGQLIVQAENVANAGYILLVQTPGSSLVNLNEAVPDATSPHMAAVADFGTVETTPPFTRGVLDRLTLRVANGATPGVYSLTLTGPPLGAYVDKDGLEYVVDRIWDANFVPKYGLVALGTTCPDQADVAITSQSLVSPPTQMPVSLNADVTLRKVLHNYGPDGPVDVSIDADAQAPADCTATPDPDNPTSANLAVSVDVVVDEVWTLHCTQPSTHVFTFNNSIAVTTGGTIDPNPSNNSASTQLIVAVIAQADVRLSSQSLLSPPSEIGQGQDVDVTLRKVLRNNGPFGPADVSISASAQAPAGCTATPKPANPTSATLPVGVDVVKDEVWTLNCSQTGNKSFSFNNSISIIVPHVTDPNIANNSASTPLNVSVVDRYAPAAEATLSAYAAGANANITTSFDLPSGDYNYDLLYSFTPPAFYVAAAGSLPVGALVGADDAASTLGLFNGACNVAANVHYDLLNCSVNTSDTVSWSNGLLDANGNNIPDGCDKYPEFLNTLFPGLTPRARLYGQTTLVGLDLTLNFPVFEPGTCLGVSGCDTTWGYPWVAVLNNPIQPDSPMAITDFCAPLSTDLVTLGLSQDNPATGVNESGYQVRRNPSLGGTYSFRWYSASQRDADADGYENGLDTCPYAINADESPRVGNGPDGDGLDSVCDPLPVGYASDQDSDGYQNRQDNCPVIANVSQTDTDRDGIGDACDSSPGVPDGGRVERTLVANVDVIVRTVSAGWYHTCGVRTDGALACWGDNDYGQATPPTGTFSRVSAGYQHTCGVRTDGALACWGNNGDGQATPPTGTFSQVSAGHSHTCGMRTDGTLACWGDNDYGQATPPVYTDLAVDLFKDENITVPEDLPYTGGDFDGDTIVDTNVRIRITNGDDPTRVAVEVTQVSTDKNKCVAHLVPEPGDTLNEFTVGMQFFSKLEWTEPLLGIGATRDVYRDYNIVCSVPGSWVNLEQFVVNVDPLDAVETDPSDNTDENHVSVLSDPDIDDDTDPNASDNCPYVPNPDQQDVDTDGVGDLCDPDTEGSSSVSDPVTGDVTVSNPGDTISFDGQTAQGGSTVTIVDDPAAVGTFQLLSAGTYLIGVKFDLLSSSALTGTLTTVATFASPGISAEQLALVMVTKEGVGPLCGQPGSPCTVTATDPPTPPYTQATIEFTLTNDAGLTGGVPYDGDADGVYDHYDANGDGDFTDPGEHDNCPTAAAPPAEDLDHDGCAAALDPDDDGDGVTDIAEAALGSSPIDAGKTPENRAVGSSCIDTIDNDGDTLTDGADPGCAATVEMIVNMSVDQSQVEAGARDIPLQSIMAGDYLQGTPLMSIPLQSIPLMSIDMEASPLHSIPLMSIPMMSISLRDLPLMSITCDSQTYEGWEDLLVGTPLMSIPLMSITLQEALDAIEAVDPDLAECPKVGDLALGAAPLQSITLVDILLGTTPLMSIPLMSIPLDPGTDWCDVLAGTPFESQCNDVSGLSVGDLLGNGVPLGAIPIQNVPMWLDVQPPSGSPDWTISGTPLMSIPLMSIPLMSITGSTWTAILAGTSLNNYPLDTTTLGQVMEVCKTDAVLRAHLTDIDGAGTDLTLGHILWGILAAAVGDIPWESVPLQSIPLQSIALHGGSVTYSIQLANTGSVAATDVSVENEMPAGFRYRTGSTTTTGCGGSVTGPSQSGGGAGQPTTLTWSGLQVSAGGTCTLSFGAYASTSLGAYVSSVSVSDHGLPVASAERAAPVTVTDNLEPNDPFDEGTAGSLPALEPGRLYLSYISSATDVDFFRIPVPAEGYSVTVYLSHLASDNDLVMYSPVESPLGSTSMQGIPLGGIPVDDVPLGQRALQEAALQDTVLDDIAIQDVLNQGVPLQGISISRGTAEETIADTALYESGNYYVQVSGYNGAYTSEPYVIRVKVQPPPGAITCSARNLPTVAAPAAPSIPSNVNTLIITNRQRLQQYYGATAATGLMTKLGQLASAPGIVGAVVPVDYDAGVRTAFADWDVCPCSISKALAVAGSIRTLVHGIVATHPTVKFLVIVGSDEIIPFARVPDEVYISNERLYGPDLSWVEDSALYAALAQGFILSDDFYADLAPISWFERELYVPDLAVGRLVEEPSEIEGVIARFLQDDTLNPSDALVTGYDFLTDAADAIVSELEDVPLSVNGSLISNIWTRADLCNILDMGCGTGTATPDIDALNAHYDHYRLLPAAYTGDLDPSDLVTTADIPVENSSDTRFNGSVLFSLGCHSGLNVPDSLGSPDARLRDFPQAWAERRAHYVGNTGYGYGDTEAVALSERLMKYFSRELFAASPSYLGEALVRAKQQYYLSMGHYPLYDEKALIEATLYGLPMYKVAGGAAPPADTPPLVTTDPKVNLPRADLPFAPTLHANIDPVKGTYFDVNGEVQVTPYRPIQPRVSQNISISTREGYENYVAHGALLAAADYNQLAAFNPVVARPTWDLEASELEPQFVSEGWSPSTLHTLNHLETGGEVRERLVVIPGQFRQETFDLGQEVGSERTYSSLDYQVYYSQASGDFTQPTFKLSEAVVSGGGAAFTAEVTDMDDSGSPGAVKRVVVIYTTTVGSGPGSWQSLELNPVWGKPNRWGGTVSSLSGSIEYLVQAVDAAGNVAVTTNKGLYYDVLNVYAGSDRSVQEGEPIGFTGTANVDPNAPGTFVMWDFGDGSTAIDTLTPTHTYADNQTTPYTVTLVVRDASGRSGSDTLTVQVSNAAPSVGVAPSLLVTRAGQSVTFHGWFTDPGSGDSHTILWDFGDGGTASGILAPAHVFVAGGAYSVELEVADDDGGTDSATASVVVFVAETCDRIDNDLDGAIDEGWDLNGNGTCDYEDHELDTDSDGFRNDADNDDDNDGFTDATENWVGTDCLDACPDIIGSDDAWPLDQDMSADISVTGDVFKYRGNIGKTVSAYPGVRRLDINMSGDISVTGDVFLYRGKIGRTCT